MTYNLPQIDLAEPEKTWLSAVHSKLMKGESVDTRTLKVELRNKLPKKFEPLEIDSRLLISGRDITLLGVWHIDPESELIERTDKVILCIRELLLKEPSRSEFNAEEVAALTGISKKNVAQIFARFLHQLGRFQEKAWNAAENGVVFGYSAIGIESEQAFDAYMQYEGIEELMYRRYQAKPDNDSRVFLTPGEFAGSRLDVRMVAASLSKFGIPDHSTFKSYVTRPPEVEPTSCIFMDLDNFKPINDDFDHSVGDRVIQEAIRVAGQVLVGKGQIFHRSGDEFILLLPNFTADEACAVADRIRREIEVLDFPTVGRDVVTATLGVSTYPTSTANLNELEVYADRAAMAAKKLGKNQVVHWDFQEHAWTVSGPVRPHEKQLRAMLEELKVNAAVASSQGNERVDYSSDRLDRGALPDEIREAVDKGYGAVKKLQMLVRRFENATTYNTTAQTGNELIQEKLQELPKITQAVTELEKYLSSP